MSDKKCQFDGCGRDIFRRDWCSKHYSRLIRYGSPSGFATRPTLEARLWSYIAKGAENDCWPWIGKSKRYGYGKIGAPGGGRTLLAHRAAYEFVNGPIPTGQCVLHRCDNPACCNPKHLFLGTQQDNLADMVAKGRHTRGENGRAKITLEHVREIRSTGAWREIAERIGISPGHAHKIFKRESWKHVPD